MSNAATELNVSDVSARRAYLAESREEVRQRLAAELPPSEICEWFSDRLDELLIAMLQCSLDRQGVSESSNLIVACVGGNGRRRPVPWSDVDLLIVMASNAGEELSDALNSFVRDCWDTGM